MHAWVAGREDDCARTAVSAVRNNIVVVSWRGFFTVFLAAKRRVCNQAPKVPILILGKGWSRPLERTTAPFSRCGLVPKK